MSGLITALVAAGWRLGGAVEPVPDISLTSLALLVWLGGIAIGASTVLWYAAGRMIGVTVTSMHHNMVPFYVIAMAALTGATVSREHVIGAVLVIAGAVLAQVPLTARAQSESDGAMSAGKRRPAAFIIAMCLAHVLTMLGFSSFPTLQPLLSHEWGMSAAEAGAVNSAFFGGYTLAVPFLVSITDRIDPRRIYLGSLVLAALAHTGFALFADGALHAALFSGLYGVSLAGTYMPGLRVMGEALPQERMARATSFYTSSFSLGAAVSYLATAQLARVVDWHGVYVVAAVCSGLAAMIVLFAAPASQPHAPNRPWLSVIDPRPVFKNRSAIAYSICYGLHSLELFTVRSWIVAFLAAIAVRQGTVTGFATPAAIAAFLTLIGMGASITGNEVALRRGRVRTIGVTMVTSGLMAFTVAAASLYSYWLAAGLAVLHGCFIMFDSAALTAGAFGSALPSQRGITMAVHSVIGFGGSMFGPLIFGGIVDIAGPQSALGWGLAYAHLGVVVAFGPLVLRWLKPAGVPGDHN